MIINVLVHTHADSCTVVANPAATMMYTQEQVQTAQLDDLSSTPEV